MAKTPIRSVRVTAASGGGWAVRDSRSAATVVHETRADAVAHARAKVAVSGGEVLTEERGGRTTTSFTLGRAAMETLNAVEGVTLSDRMRELLEGDDAAGLNGPARRASLRAAAAGKAGT